MEFHEGGNPDVVLLVGGLGTRLRSALGEGTPKSLALINGRPFLWYLLRYISDQGFDRVKLATAHLSEAFKSEFQSYVPEGMDIRFSFEESPRGTGGALVQALPIVETEPFIAMNGDGFVHVPLKEMVEYHRTQGAVATLALVEVEDMARFGTVLTRPDGTIEAFREKTGLSEHGWISAGVYVLSKEAFEPVKAMETSSIEKDVFPYWVDKGLYGFKVQSPFIDIGLPDTYAAAGKFFEDCGYA
jgi:NDP-sugar pyrophosphorylase family protein